MYEELVKRLREPCQYENCVLCQQAANAIEELSCEYESISKSLKSLTESLELVRKLQSPRWVSVTERLPEDRSDVLAYLKYEVGGRIAAANYDKGTWQDCVMGGLYRTEEGVVTHWMPIPQPPKEEAPAGPYDLLYEEGGLGIR